jgi:hypothetical protein
MPRDRAARCPGPAERQQCRPGPRTGSRSIQSGRDWGADKRQQSRAGHSPHVRPAGLKEGSKEKAVPTFVAFPAVQFARGRLPSGSTLRREDRPTPAVPRGPVSPHLTLGESRQGTRGTKDVPHWTIN